MQTENWEKVKVLLDQVLELDDHQRQEFLDRSNINTEIRAEVESLISFESEAHHLMNFSAIEISKDFFYEEDNPNALIGTQIGVYQIVGELGHGGMGAVYLAERNDGKFEQKAALKLLKREFNTKKLRRSFKRESEIQSKLHHPNIAQLLDVGMTDDGIPYLIMEYVEGETIDDFCEQHNLSLKDRLKLFNKVCEAVSAAHQNLIIHRDLKPSNILVGNDGIPKLLDFGISKILNKEQPEETNAFTMLAAMTPEYASPEQIKGEKVTTASDIYSLGVVLYKILTGSLPYHLKDKTNSNLLKTINETDPPKPSSQSTNPNSAIHSPQLKGDIDNIILKALSKEPERRYQTVEQFSADLWRFIDGLPVLARPATISYRAHKFFQRNKIAVLAGILVFVSLIAGMAVVIRQARIAAESQNLALAESVKAKSEQAKSEKITRFMSKIIGYANPAWFAEGSKLKGQARVIDAIEDLSSKIDVEFASEPDVAAELHHKFSEIFLFVSKDKRDQEFNFYQQKRAFHALRALELRKQVYGEWHELVAKDLFYAYGIIGRDTSEKAELLMRSMMMMRDTNHENLNFPYIIEAYTTFLMMPEYSEASHEIYRKAFLPATDENKYQIAEHLLCESLPVFRLHYKEDNSAIFGTECKLSYSLARQEKWTDFDEHYAICRQYAEKLKTEDSAKNMKYYVGLIESVLAENKRPN